MNCPKCSAPNADGAKFCASCGAAMTTASPPPGGPTMPDFAKKIITPGLIARVKAILLTPAQEWLAIDAEETSASAIYIQYVAPLAAIGAIAGFIGRSIVGVSIPFFGTYRAPIISGLIMAVLMYALTFVTVWVVAFLADALAPTFGGQKDPIRALKVSAYSYTPAWIAGIFQILPSLAFVGLIAALYGLYLLYLGLPILMRSPKDKAIAYTGILCVCAIVLYLVIGMISAAVIGGAMGLGALGTGGFGGPSASLTSPSGDSSGNGAIAMLTGIFGGKSDADRERVANSLAALQKMGQQADQAEKAARANGGNPDTAGAKTVDPAAALGALGTVLTGGNKVKPVDFHALKAMLPDSLPGMKRDDASGETNEALGISAAKATAHYSDGNGKDVSVEITDMGSLSGLASLATKFDPNQEKETDTGYERTTHVNGQLVHEQYDNRYKNGQVDIIAGNRFSVTVHGNGVDMDFLTNTLKQIDFEKLASLQTAN